MFQILAVIGLWREDLGIGCHIVLAKKKIAVTSVLFRLLLTAERLCQRPKE